MIGGQQQDLEGGHDLAELHRLKTGALFSASVMCGVWAAGVPDGRARAVARVRGGARAALPGRRRHPRRRRLRRRGRRGRGPASSPTRPPSARRGAARGDPGRHVGARARSSRGSPHAPRDAQAARRAARRARARREPGAGAGARDGRARAGPRRSPASRSTRRRRSRSSSRPPYVSRAGRKLANALDAFGVDPAGLDCLDLGASTGGFTDVLLQRGAARVIALDVGHGQLHPRIRNDPRVTVLERTNARTLDRAAVRARSSSRATCRSSRCVSRCRRRSRLAAPGWQALVLVKPQFEAGRAEAEEGRRPRPGGPAARAARGRGGRARLGGTGRRGRRLGASRPQGKP